MRILSNDFGGYPYPVQLARELARRGHDVLHTHCTSLTTTPGGATAPRADDPAGFETRGLTLARPLEKYNFGRRFLQEREYGRLVAQAARSFRPDVVLSANTPLDAQNMLLRETRTLGAGFVFWLQDIIGIAAERLLRGKIPVVGALVGQHYVRMEARMLRESDHVVNITDDFAPILAGWGVRADRMTTVENWAPVEELPLGDPSSAWARETGLDRDLVFLYAGTLALKHNPDLLLNLAVQTRDRRVDGRAVRVVVLSQGPGADYLREQAAARGLANLDVRGFKPFSEMPEAMAAADVLVAVLEPDAGVFSVPSKVLAYLCGGRPVLLAVPTENLAARIVAREGAGFVVPPDDAAGFLESAEALLARSDLRDEMGRAARTYAETAFPITAIADRMERVLTDARRGAHPAR
ncbi:MAG TPA: glycosyltransferase family 4 protein [Rubricoccaceae bacterium]|jgi:glycosyltransferase involved in cell wall biosynthesis